MKTATHCLYALFLLLVVGSLSDELGSAGNAAEKEKNAIASESPEQAAKEPLSTPSQSKPALAEIAAEIIGLIPKASAMAREEMEKLATSDSAPKESDLENKSFTFMFFLLRPKEHAEAKEQFQMLTSRPKASDLVEEVYRVGTMIGRFPVVNGPVTCIHADRMTGFTCDVEGDMARGTVSFKVPDLYQGKVDYVAERKDGKWTIEEFILPAYDIHVVRNAEGTWEKLSLEQRIATSRMGIDAIDLNVSAKRTVQIKGDETPIEDADAVLSRLSRYSEKRGKKPAAVLVRIAVDDQASYGDCTRVFHACQKSRFERFVLQCGKDCFPFSAPLAVPSEGLPAEDMLPPMRVRLKASRTGELAQISLNDNNFGTSFDSLHNYIIAVIGDERGPGSVADTAEVELDCDDALKFKHVADACRSVSYFVAEDDTRVSLIEKVFPLGVGGTPRGELMPLDDMENSVVTEVVLQDVTDVAVANDLDASSIAVDLVDFGTETAPKGDLLGEIGRHAGTGLSGRGTSQSRAAAVEAFGGNAQSEAAVAAALKWLAAAQTADGGWNFDHRSARDPAVRTADHHGNLTSARNAATAMAILPFLGAGQTHVDGEYKATVTGGLAYLMSHMKRDGSMSESGGSMYSHGLGAIALCEAYAMTHDKKLLAPAQASLNFIAYAQDPVGGGWRYQPRQPGDTSVTAWQLMGLKSGHAAYLQVHPNTVRGATKFLDSVQAGDGAYYGYTTPAKRGTTSAMGLLCRMYLGWARDREALSEGVKYLSAQGPSNTDMYFNYYATQVMFQYGGEHWDKWNERMRDYLMNEQDKADAAKGSWYFAGGHGADRGGRIYNTSLATMILEVYYRHPRIYEKKAASKK